MKKRVIFAAMAAVIAMVSGAQAGWLDEVKARLSITNTTQQIQEYLPAEEASRPELEIKDNGILGYHAYKDVWIEDVSEVTGRLERYKLREPSIWGRGGTSVLYNTVEKHMLVLLDGRKGEFHYRAYYLKAEPMQKLLDAIATHWEGYKAYVEKPTPEGEKKILSYADVQAALDSVKDAGKRKVKKPTSVSINSIDQEAAIARAKEHFEARDRGNKSELDAEYELADPRKTDERDAAYRKFVYGETMSLKLRGENPFDPQVTKEEETAGAATKVRLYYVGAWLDAISHGYQPKVFRTVRLNLVLPKITFITKREIPEIFVEAEKTASMSKEEQAYIDPSHVFKGTFKLNGEKMMATDRATGKVFPLKMTDQLKGMVAIGEMENGGFLQFKVADGEAIFVPSLKNGMKLSGRVVSMKDYSDATVVKVKLLDSGKEADFYVSDKRVKSRIPRNGIIDFVSVNMFMGSVELQQ